MRLTVPSSGHAQMTRQISGRLYIVAIVAALIAFALAWAGFQNYSSFVHQSIGAMLIAGCIWFGDLFFHAAFDDIRKKAKGGKGRQIQPSTY